MFSFISKPRCSQSTLVKLLAFFLVFGVVSSIVIDAHADLPGFKRVEAPLVSIEDAREFFEKQEETQDIPMKGPQVRGPTDAGPEIVELVKRFKSDPRVVNDPNFIVDLIYQYVHNNIEYTPIFGSLKVQLEHYSIRRAMILTRPR